MRVLAIDGMDSTGIIWRELILKMKAKYPQLESTYCEWQDWEKHLSIDFDIITGHSLGGDSAIRFCNRINALIGATQPKRPKPKLLITMGARHPDFVSWTDWLFPWSPFQNFVAPNANTHNFWTAAPLASDPIPGAVENVCVQPVPYVPVPVWHGNIPSAPQVHACFDKFMAENAK